MPNQQATLNQIFHALSDPTRRALLRRLSRGPASVGELARPFDIALPSFLQHLNVLEQSGLIRSRKKGRVRTCEVVPQRLAQAEKWIADQRTVWEGRLHRMEQYVIDLKAKETKT
jgi:DNA-binding transcriptional ArsR family regulator